MNCVNKWNKKKYVMVESQGSKITLERSDGSRFTIAISEFQFNYVPCKNKLHMKEE